MRISVTISRNELLPLKCDPWIVTHTCLVVFGKSLRIQHTQTVSRLTCRQLQARFSGEAEPQASACDCYDLLRVS